MKPAHARPQPTEAEFARMVIDFARLHRWKVAHFRPARVTRRGVEKYETPVAADGKGWPDLVLCRGGRIVFAELKSARGKTSGEQDAWLALLRTVPGAEAHVWRLTDWDLIVATLGKEP